MLRATFTHKHIDKRCIICYNIEAMKNTNRPHTQSIQPELQLHPWLEAESHGDPELRVLLGNKEHIIDTIASGEVDPDLGEYDYETRQETTPSLRMQLSDSLNAVNQRKHQLGIAVREPLPLIHTKNEST